jgi:uncharacterized protein (TIRG00374 family)
MRNKKLIGSLVFVGLNLAIFYFLLRWCLENIRLDLLAREFAQMPLTAVALTVMLNLIAIACYALRLGVLIGRKFGISLATTFLGFGLNSVLPFRLGEIAKLYYAKRYFLIPITSLFAATLVEKLFDLSAVAFLAALIVTLADINVIQKSIVIALIAVVLAGYAAVLSYRKLAHHIERVAGTSVRVQALLAALREQSRLHHLHQIVCYTLVIWALNTTVIYAGFSGFLPDYPIGVLDAIALLLISALAIVIPTAPAGIGLFEAGVVAYLTQVRGVPNEPALAAAVVFHIVIIVPLLTAIAWIMLRSQWAPDDERTPH